MKPIRGTHAVSGMEIAGHIDALDQRESLRSPLLVSIGIHVALFGFIFGYSATQGRTGLLWGNPHSLGGGGSVGITPVKQIPLPSKGGPVNPVANDTESNVPAPPKPQAVKRTPPAPDAIPLPGRKTAKPEPWKRPAPPSYRTGAQDRPNQLYSSTGQALSSPMYGAQTGTGGVGVGPGSAFGNRFGYYRDLLEQKVSQKWHTEDVDARLRTAPPVIINFEILRNGSVRDVRILQGSGNRALDYSAQRAIYEANPFPALPAGFEGSSARIEFWFTLKR
jgi:periplasmic protein TonB